MLTHLTPEFQSTSAFGSHIETDGSPNWKFSSSAIRTRPPKNLVQKLAAECERPWFQSFGGLIIALNAVVIGLETDFPQYPHWSYVEHVFLVVFVIELGVRILHFGFGGLVCHPTDWGWNSLDVFIVGSGIVDMWVLGLYCKLMNVPQSHNKILTLLRMFRLLRLMRLLRQLKQVQQLYDLSVALIQATEAMGWMLILCTVFLYGVSIMTTNLIGHGLGIPDQTLARLYAEVTEAAMDTEVVERRLKGGNANGVAAGIDVIQGQFATVPESMYTLFQVVAGWVLTPFDALLAEVAWLKLAFIVFWIFTSWALVSVMTGTVSEGMVHQQEVAQQIILDEKLARVASLKTDLLRSVAKMNVTREKVEQIEEDLMLAAGPEDAVLFKESLFDFYEIFDLMRGDSDRVPGRDFVMAMSTASQLPSSRGVLKLESAHWKARNSIHLEVETLQQNASSCHEKLERVAALLQQAVQAR